MSDIDKAPMPEKGIDQTLLGARITKQINIQIANQLNTGILVVDAQLTIIVWNRFLQVHTGKKSENVLEQSIFSVFPELPVRWLSRKLNSVLQLNTPSFCSWEQRHHLFNLPHTRPITTDSDFMAQNCTFLPIVTDTNDSYICILIEDVTDVCHYQTQLKKALAELAKINRIDGLTQIYNRRHWQKSLEQEYAKARRHDKKLSLIMLDLDHFKQVNDQWGHEVGNHVLKMTARLIGQATRQLDIQCRYGGEEFVVILPSTSLLLASQVAERLRELIEHAEMDVDGQALKVTTSIGLSVRLANERGSADRLIKEADECLYQAKHSGRNKVFFHSAEKTVEAAVNSDEKEALLGMFSDYFED